MFMLAVPSEEPGRAQRRSAAQRASTDRPISIRQTDPASMLQAASTE